MESCVNEKSHLSTSSFPSIPRDEAPENSVGTDRVVMPSCRHDVAQTLGTAIPLLNQLLDPVQGAVCATPQHDHAHHAFACARLIAHKLHAIPIPIVRQRQPGGVKSVRPGGNALLMPEIDGFPVA